MDAKELAPELVKARELDADGRHDDAINELARAAQRGDVEATTRLAKRIIVGDRAPQLRRQGIDLLKDAVNRGGAEAAERLAVVFATGVAGDPDWRSALRMMALAADRGWVPARRQLEVLATIGGSKSPTSTPAHSPQAVAENLDLQEMLVPEPGAVIHDDPRVCVFPGFIAASICSWLIESARNRLERALVYDVVNQTDFAGETRTNSAATFHMMNADLVHLLVQTRIAAACGQPVAHLEAPTILHYAIGETIGDHYDFVDPDHPAYADEIRIRGTRIITFLVYLNADYEGGETVFPRLDLSHSGQLGDGMYFVNALADGRADVRTLHNGRPPVTGEKWIFSQFVRNRRESTSRQDALSTRVVSAI
jgi:prolyl 4-hydroxylase